MTWKKGQRPGNPKGAPPRGASFREVIDRELREIDPRSGLPYRIAIVQAMAKLAVSGDPRALEAARWLADRSDGRVAQSISVESTQTTHIVPWLPHSADSAAWRPGDSRVGGGGQMVDVAALPAAEAEDGEAEEPRLAR